MVGGRYLDARETGVLVAGLVIAALLFLRDPYLGGIVLVLVLTLAMAFFIMGETGNLPEVTVRLSDDARRIELVNRGNDRALRIHITLVPLDRELELAELSVDGMHEFPLPAMVAEVKALVRYENAAGRRFSRSFRLSAIREEEDLLKPLFPTFGWK
jgi:hypothetical protein